MICAAPKGPVRRIAAEHVMDCYLIWDFAENKDGAQQFLIDFIDAFHDSFIGGQFYNFPCFPGTVPNLKQEISNDPRANPRTNIRPSATFSIGRQTWVIPVTVPP